MNELNKIKAQISSLEWRKAKIDKAIHKTVALLNKQQAEYQDLMDQLAYLNKKRKQRNDQR